MLLSSDVDDLAIFKFSFRICDESFHILGAVVQHRLVSERDFISGGHDRSGFLHSTKLVVMFRIELGFRPANVVSTLTEGLTQTISLSGSTLPEYIPSGTATKRAISSAASSKTVAIKLFLAHINTRTIRETYCQWDSLPYSLCIILLQGSFIERVNLLRSRKSASQSSIRGHDRGDDVTEIVPLLNHAEHVTDQVILRVAVRHL